MAAAGMGDPVTGTRYLMLNAYLRNSGYHEAAWRMPAADPAAVLDPRYYIGLARTAERGVLDSIFLPDSPGVAEFRAEYLPDAALDPLQLRIPQSVEIRQAHGAIAVEGLHQQLDRLLAEFRRGDGGPQPLGPVLAAVHGDERRTHGQSRLVGRPTPAHFGELRREQRHRETE